MVKRILKILDKPESLIKFVKDRPGHDLRYAMNYSKISKKMGWKPEMNLDDGLKKTVEWYKTNRQWLNNVITKEYLNYYEKQYKS